MILTKTEWSMLQTGLGFHRGNLQTLLAQWRGWNKRVPRNRHTETIRRRLKAIEKLEKKIYKFLGGNRVTAN